MTYPACHEHLLVALLSFLPCIFGSDPSGTTLSVLLLTMGAIALDYHAVTLTLTLIHALTHTHTHTHTHTRDARAHLNTHFHSLTPDPYE